jgi:peptidoglycan hydrolase-like protein with peptidoglycan-binding domain
MKFLKNREEALMKKSCLAILSGLAFGGAVIVNAPHAWSQDTPGGTSEKSGSESRVQKPTDPPVSTSRQTGSSQSGMSRSEGTGMQAGTESRGAGKWSKDKVKAIQEALKSKGFDPGEADGVVGPKTGQALREFQKSQNLQVTGRIDDKTVSALGVDTAGGGSPSSSTGKESASGSRGTTGPSSGTSGKGSSSGTGSSSADQPGARGGTTIDPPSKPTGKE